MAGDLKPYLFYLVVLSLLHLNIQWQQYLLVYLRDGTDPRTNFQVELGMTDAQYGFISGFAYTIVNQVSMFITCQLVDRANRKLLLFVFSVLWNASCMMIFFVRSYSQLLILRVAFAALCSVSQPACVSLINEYFPKEYRARANSVYVTAVSFGVCCANLSTLLNEKYGWRNSALISASIGMTVALLTVFIKEPRTKNTLKTPESIPQSDQSQSENFDKFA